MSGASVGRASVVLVGVQGFGAVHRRSLAASSRARLVAGVDPVVHASGERSVDGAPLFASLAEAIAAVGVPDVVIAAVPIPVHASVTAEALRAGADVLLEKPPFATMDDLEALLTLEAETGGRVQVGFQSLGSHALADLDADRFGIGEICHVRAMGTWVRDTAYWRRSPWAGRRSIGDTWVMDGVATNPFAHAVATALRIAGVSSSTDVSRVDVDAYRVAAIDTDDTTALRIVAARTGAPTVSAALTLAAAEEADPVVEVVGSAGVVTFRYTRDEVVLPSGDVVATGRTDLLENLLDHRATGVDLLVPLAATGAFMRVVEALRTAPAPVRVPGRFAPVVESRSGSGSGSGSRSGSAHPVLLDAARWVRAAADVDGTFVDAGAPWAFAGRDGVLASSSSVLTLLDGAGTVPSSSPRPFVHPVRTSGGTVLTDLRPADHDWHLGLGFTVADADGTNFWGGGTFVRERGYVDLDDHGSQRIVSVRSSSADAIELDLTWIDRDGAPLLTEHRAHRVEPLGDGVVRITLGTTLVADHPVTLGSPATHGRERAGYGGWFWRLPPCADVAVVADGLTGEDAVLGSDAPWMSWTGRFLGTPGTTGEATIVLTQPGRADPWFVRSADYPGIGTAVAWERETVVESGVPFERSLVAVIADGRRDPASLLS